MDVVGSTTWAAEAVAVAAADNADAADPADAADAGCVEDIFP